MKDLTGAEVEVISGGFTLDQLAGPGAWLDFMNGFNTFPMNSLSLFGGIGGIGGIGASDDLRDS